MITTFNSIMNKWINKQTNKQTNKEINKEASFFSYILIIYKVFGVVLVVKSNIIQTKREKERDKD